MGLLVGVGDFGIGDLIARAEALYALLEELCGDSLSWENIINKPTTLADFGITDAYTQTEIAALLAGKMDADFEYSWNDLLDRPTNIADSGILDVYTKEEVDELIGDLAIGEHTHEISDIVGLEDALDALQFKLVSDLPATPAKNSIYCVYAAGKFTLYVTDGGSTPIVYNLDAVTAAQLATALNSKQNKLTGTDAQYVKGDGSYGTFNKAAIGLGNVANLAPADYPISDAQAAVNTSKANDSEVLKKTGNQTKTSGVLEFMVSPVVPVATNSGDAVNLGQVTIMLSDAVGSPFSVDFGNGIDTNYILNHGLNSEDLHVIFTRNSDDRIVELAWGPVDVDNIEVVCSLRSIPSTDFYHAIILDI